MEGVEECQSRFSAIEESQEAVSAYHDSEDNASAYHRSSTVLEDNTNLPLDTSKTSTKQSTNCLPSTRLYQKMQASPTKP